MRMVLMAMAMAALGGVAPATEPVVAYTITNGSEIAASLTGAPGDGERGRLLYAGESRAGCPGCHGVPGAPAGEPKAMKTDGPDLAGVGARLTEGEIRLWIAAPEVLHAETKMPAYFAAGQRTDPDDPLYGGPALTAAEIEDLVAYLVGLK